MDTTKNTERRGKKKMELIKRVRAFKCQRCSWEWVPRQRELQDPSSDEQPTICPKCNSPYWDKPRKTPLIKEENVK